MNDHISRQIPESALTVGQVTFHQFDTRQTRPRIRIKRAVKPRDPCTKTDKASCQRTADKAPRSGDQDTDLFHAFNSAMLAGSKFARLLVCSVIRRTASSTSCASSARTIGGWVPEISKRLGWTVLRSAMI